MNETASCFLHGDFDATLRHCPECEARRSNPVPSLGRVDGATPERTMRVSQSGFGDATAAQIGEQQLERP